MSKPAISIISLIVIFIVSLLNLYPTKAANNQDVSNVWQKVQKANRVWVNSINREVTYQLISEGDRNNEQTIWYKGPDKVRVEERRKEGYRTHLNIKIYNDGFLGWNMDQMAPFYRIEEVPYGYGIGLPFAPLFISALINPPNNLSIINQDMVDGNPVIILQVENYQAQMNLNFAFSNHEALFERIRFFVDANNFTFVRIEAEFSPAMMRELTEPIVWEFPDGYELTSEGYAPRMIEMHTQAMNQPVQIQYRFQFLPGNIWFGDQASLHVSSFQRKQTIRVANPVIGFIDPSKFDFAAAGMQIKEPTEGTGMISGVVENLDTQMPLAGAKVKLYGEPSKLKDPLWAEVMTDYDGAFHFDQLPDQETYWLVAEKEGWLSGMNKEDQWYINADIIDPIKNAFRRILVRDGSQHPNQNLILALPRTVRGKVIHSNTGEPVNDAEVIAQPVNLERKSRDTSTLSILRKKVTTNSDGAFQLTDLAAMNYSFYAQKEGYYPFPNTQSPQGDAQQIINLQEITSKDNLVLKIYPTGVIEGRVLNSQGEGVDGASVYIWGYPQARSLSDEQGNYRLEGLHTEEIGSTQKSGLIANASGYIGNEFQPVSIPSSHTPLQHDIVLESGGRLAGTVYSGSSETLAGLQLNMTYYELRMSTDREMSMARRGVMKQDYSPISKEDGNYQSGRLIAGKYTISAATDGYLPFSGEVMIKNDEITELDVCLKPVPPISGKIVSVTGDPIEGVSLLLYEKGTERPVLDNNPNSPETHPQIVSNCSVRSEADGSFAFNKTETGEYALFVQSPPKKGYVQQEAWLPNVKSGQTGIEIQLQPYQKTAVFEGTVVDGNTGQPIPDYHIRLTERPDNDDLVNMGDYIGKGVQIQNQEGSFRLDKITPKYHEFVVLAKGYAAREIGPYKFQPEETKTAFVQLLKGGVVTGRVDVIEIKSGEKNFAIHMRAPISAEVGYHRQEGYPHEYYVGQYYKSPNGQFRIPHISPGIYDFWFQGNNQTIASATMVQATAGETIDLGLLPKFNQVERAKTKDIVIKNVDGEPIPDLKVFSPWPNLNSAKILSSDPQGKIMLGYYQLNISGNFLLIGVGENPTTVYGFHLNKIPDEIVYHQPNGNSTLKGVLISRSSEHNAMQVMLLSDRDEGTFLAFQDTTNLLGRFSISNIPAGNYHLLIGYSDKNKSTMPFRWIPIEIKDGDEQFLEISMKGQTIQGQVKDYFDQPIAGAHVQLRSPMPKGKFFPRNASWGPFCSTMTDEFGVFSFENCQAGDYEIWSSRFTFGISSIYKVQLKDNKLEQFIITIP